MLKLARRGRGARNLPRQPGAISFCDHHAVANLQAKLIGLCDDAFTPRIGPDHEFHRVSSRRALLNGATNNASRKSANHAGYGARAPIAADGAANKTTTGGTRGYTHATSGPGYGYGAHGDNRTAINRSLDAKGLTFHGAIARRRGTSCQSADQQDARKTKNHNPFSCCNGASSALDPSRCKVQFHQAFFLV
jgi:hypothetical protein